MIRYAELLRAHSKIPKHPRKRSFFEISGYPHYENVCSNILGFFLNPGNEHGLKDLLLKSIGECIGQADLVFSLDGSVEVLREKQSLNGGRIDILIETPRHIIAIEHKIFHWLANDLDDYWKTIASRTKEPIGIVLALRKSQVKHPHFKSIEYAELISSVQRNLGQYVMEADRDYLYLLTSFFKTIQNLQGITMDELEFEFFANNFQATSDLVDAYSRFLTELDSTVQKLGGILFGGNRHFR